MGPECNIIPMYTYSTIPANNSAELKDGRVKCQNMSTGPSIQKQKQDYFELKCKQIVEIEEEIFNVSSDLPCAFPFKVNKLSLLSIYRLQSIDRIHSNSDQAW